MVLPGILVLGFNSVLFSEIHELILHSVYVKVHTIGTHHRYTP